MKCLFSILESCSGPRGYCYTSPRIFYDNNTIINMTKTLRLKVSLDLEFRAPKLVKVKAHKRQYRDKITKVLSHYRRVWRRA